MELRSFTRMLTLSAVAVSCALLIGACAGDDGGDNGGEAVCDNGIDDDNDGDIDCDDSDCADDPACTGPVCGLQNSEVTIATSAIHPDTDYGVIAGASCAGTIDCATGGAGTGTGNPQLYLPTGITGTLFDARECLNHAGADTFLFRLQALIQAYLVDQYNDNNAGNKAVIAMGNVAGWGYDRKIDETVLCDDGYQAPPWNPQPAGFLQQGWGNNNDLYLANMKVRDLVQIFERQVGGKTGEDEAWPETWGSWLVVSAPSTGETRIVFNMECTPQEYDEEGQSIPIDGERLVDLVIGGTRYTASDLDDEVNVIVTGFVGLQVPPAPDGARHYAFKNATFTQLTRGDIGLTTEPTDSLKEWHVIEEWLASVGNCLDGDDIAGQKLDIGFASDEQATIGALCQ